MSNNKMNFRALLTKYKIEIPILQRDYVQGRESHKVKLIRERFLKDVKKVLDDTSSSLHLDFIYGFIENEKFIPLDGQQRLTTLFLLHWYFKLKKELDIDLTRFTYESHKNVKNFMNFLLGSDTFPSNVKDDPGFKDEWEREPSIKGMLVMLQAIHVAFKDTKPASYKLDNITFSFWNMEGNNLSDDLYIKMNSRGKPLTDFENFKARFETIIEGKTKLDLFKSQIDGAWTDFFWEYKDDKERAIDYVFMRFFWNITEILYFKNLKDAENTKSEKNPFEWKEKTPILNYDLIEKTYEKSVAVEELIEILNAATKLGKNGIETYFSGRFCKKENTAQHDKYLSLYSSDDVDLFNEACNKDLSQAHLLLLYSVLKFGFTCAIDKLRIVRNLVLSDPNNMRASLFVLQIKVIDNIVKDGRLCSKVSGFTQALVDEENEKLKILEKMPAVKKIVWKLENNVFLNSRIIIFDDYLKPEKLDELKKLEHVFSLYFDSSQKYESSKWDLLRRALLTQSYNVDYATRKDIVGKYDTTTKSISYYFDFWDGKSAGKLRCHICHTLEEWKNTFSNRELDYQYKRKYLVLALLKEIQSSVDKADIEAKFQDLANNYTDQNNPFYLMIKNAAILKFSERKRFTWAAENTENMVKNNVKRKIETIFKLTDYGSKSKKYEENFE